MQQGYKQTEVGMIPEDWGCVAAKHLMKIETGSRNTEHKTDMGKYPFFVRSQKVEHIDTYHYNCEAVLTAGDGVGTGKVFHHFVGKFDAHQRVYVMSNFDGITGRYFYNYFSENFGKEVSKYTAKSSVDSVRRDMIAEMMIPLPPLEEQKRIAEALSNVDGMISSLEKLIAKKKAIKQGAMQELLTGKKRLPGFVGEWRKCKLKDVLTVEHGQSQHAIEDVNGKYPILATGGIIGRANSYLYDQPSVLIGRKGTIDKPQYMETPFWTIDTLFYTKISTNYHAKYIFYVFCLIDWLDYNEASGVPSLSASVIENIDVIIPELREQVAIASILCDIDNEIESLEQKLEKTHQIKQGMMQQLLTGKIRLIYRRKRWIEI